MNLADEIRKIMKSPDFIQKILERLEERTKKEEELLKKNYPTHAEHIFEFSHDEYFDAMFVSLTYKCSCGEELILTREMVETK